MSSSVVGIRVTKETTGAATPARKARGFGFERRAEILDAAERIFVTHGYAGATVRKIAEDVGVSPTALYLHFPDKYSMLMEIGSRALDEMYDEAHEIASGPGDARDKLKSVLLAHIRYGLKHKSAYQLIFTEGARDIVRDKGETREKAVRYYRVLPRLVARLSNEDRLPKGTVHGVSQTLWAGCHGLLTYLINMPAFGWVEVDELMQLMVDGLVDGLVPE
jgi:AcrR family transcriptional regulator